MREALAIIATLAVCGLLAWIFWPATPLPVGEAVPARPAEEVRGTPQVVYAGPKIIYVYPEAKKEALNLPPSVVANEQEKVISTAKVPADDRSHTVTTTLDMPSGQAISYVRADPLPWLAPETRGEIGLAYGVKDGEPALRLSARQNLLQMKAVRLGAQGTIDDDGEWFAGVGGFYRW